MLKIKTETVNNVQLLSLLESEELCKMSWNIWGDGTGTCAPSTFQACQKPNLHRQEKLEVEMGENSLQQDMRLLCFSRQIPNSLITVAKSNRTWIHSMMQSPPQIKLSTWTTWKCDSSEEAKLHWSSMVQCQCSLKQAYA